MQKSFERAILLICLQIFAVLLLLTCIPHANSAKILVLHPLHGGSHKLQLEMLSSHLVKRGHQVTSVSFLNVGDKPKPKGVSNITTYVLTVDNSDGRYPYMTRERHGRFRFPVELFWKSGHNPHYLPLNAFKMTEALCRGLFEKVELLTSLRSEKFDMAIVDVISNECGLALSHQLSIPSTIAYWALFPVNGEMDYIGSFSPPSYVPSFLSQLDERMNFMERLYNTYLRIGGSLVMELQFYLSHKYAREFFPHSPHPKELIANLSAVLINSDFSLDYPKLLPPNALNVGCMQCRDPLPLSKEMEDFMESSGDWGVIVLSMGASFDAAVAKSLLPKLFDAFSRLPQKILMKIQSPTFANVPPNVKLVRWFPQQDVLGHPKTKGFLTHCGLHGVLEAIWHGVPMVGLPIFGDQFDVLARLKERGIAVGLRKEASPLEIYEAVQSILNSTRVRRQSRRLQRLLKDQKEHPLQRAIWNIEYTLRTNGGKHLKLGSRHLTWFQLYCFDVLIALTLTTLLLIWLLYKTCRLLILFVNKFSSVYEVCQEMRSTKDFYWATTQSRLPRPSCGGTNLKKND